jgi:multisubunit Na+/H+ antiporter MnhF subunit
MLSLSLIIIILYISVLVIGLLFVHRDIFTKLLFLNSLTSLVALFICFLGSFASNNTYIDIALIYFILSFVSNLAYLKYFLLQPVSKK